MSLLYPALSFLFQLISYILFYFIQVFIWILLNFVDYSYNHSFKSFGISLISSSFESIIVELVAFEGVMCLIFSYLLCFYIGICTEEAKSLGAGCNHLYSFSWSILRELGSEFSVYLVAEPIHMGDGGQAIFQPQSQRSISTVILKMMGLTPCQKGQDHQPPSP
jgi:hypothetical protein